MGDRDVTKFLEDGGDPEQLMSQAERSGPDLGHDPSVRRSIPLSNVVSKPTSWLWSLYLPVGALVSLSGLPGQGKTTIVADLAARLSVGGGWPDGAGADEAATVLLISSEDSAETLRGRIEAAGGDLDRVRLLPFVVGERGQELPLSFPDDLETVEQEIKLHGAKLVVIDPLDAMMGKSESNSSSSVRDVALTRLTGIAGRTGATIVYLGHPPKAGNGRAVHAFAGSQAYVSASRIAFVVGTDPDDPDRFVFACSKSNLGMRPDSLCYVCESSVPGDPTAPPKISWGGPSIVDADALVAGASSSGGGMAHERAKELILEALRRNALRSTELDTLREAQKVGKATFKRARADLAKGGLIEEYREGFPAVTWWRLVAKRTGMDAEATIPLDLTGKSHEFASVEQSAVEVIEDGQPSAPRPDELPPLLRDLPDGFIVGEL